MFGKMKCVLFYQEQKPKAKANVSYVRVHKSHHDQCAEYPNSNKLDLGNKTNHVGCDSSSQATGNRQQLLDNNDQWTKLLRPHIIGIRSQVRHRVDAAVDLVVHVDCVPHVRSPHVEDVPQLSLHARNKGRPHGSLVLVRQQILAGQEDEQVGMPKTPKGLADCVGELLLDGRQGIGNRRRRRQCSRSHNIFFLFCLLDERRRRRRVARAVIGASDCARSARRSGDDERHFE